MYSKLRSSKLFVLAISILFIIGAYVLWWENTVVAVLFLMAATFLMVSIICNCCAYSMSDRVMSARVGYTQGGRIITFGPKEDKQVQRPRKVKPVDTSILPHDIPIQVLEGPSERHVETLSRVGVFAISDLIYFGPESIVDVCDVTLQTAVHWVTDAKAIFEIAGLKTLEDLAAADPAELLEAIQIGMEISPSSLPEKYSISIDKTTYWVKKAGELLP
jgi:hypothetical protein